MITPIDLENRRIKHRLLLKCRRMILESKLPYSMWAIEHGTTYDVVCRIMSDRGHPKIEVLRALVES